MDTKQNSECEDAGALLLYCQKAVESVEAVLKKPPRERNQIVDFGEREIVRLRDCLIERYRQAANGSAEAQPAAQEVTAKLRSALDQVNIASSLITGVEYPGAGIQEKLIREALDILKQLLHTFEGEEFLLRR